MTTTSEAINKRTAAIFASASFVAGGLNYLFQVYSAKKLGLVEFGELTSWIAYFSLGFSFAALAQYGANFFVVGGRALRLLALALSFVAIGISGVPFIWPEYTSWLEVGVLGVFLGVSFSWLLGQAQVRLQFMAMSVAVVMAALGRFMMAELPYPLPKESLAFAWGVSLSFAPAVWLMAVSFWFSTRSNRPRIDRTATTSQNLLATFVLAYASVMIPQIDVIVIDQTQSPAQVGAFARVSIVYKAVFFSFLILAQLLLPYQIRQGQKDIRRGWSLRFKLMALSLMVCGLGIVASGFALSWIDANASEGDAWTWIILSCLNMAVMTNLFLYLQLHCVRGKPAWGLAVVAGISGIAVTGILAGWKIDEYLAFALMGNALIWLLQGVPDMRLAAPEADADATEGRVPLSQ